VIIDIDEFCRKLVADAPDGIVYSGADGLIRFWNHSSERIFVFSQSDALGKTLNIIIPQQLRKRHWDGYARTMRTGATRYGSGDVLAVPATRRDGFRISVEFTILPFADQDGQMIGIAVIFRDVSSRLKEIKNLRAKLAIAQGGSAAVSDTNRTR
jgi:PAS domain S-box-containing protein